MRPIFLPGYTAGRTGDRGKWTKFNVLKFYGSYTYNGSEVPQGQNRLTINLAQNWVKNGFCVIGWNWPKSGSKVGFGADFVKKNAPKPTLNPLLGHFQPMARNPFLAHFLRQITCLTILALRDLRPIIILYIFDQMGLPCTSRPHRTPLRTQKQGLRPF